ncbi:MAG: 6-phosphogluconate dehydrogenase (decarboxylating) [Candidatus Levybacteria bacterium RIFCSPHIGHO2_02_FULL_37_13]|nr:MAG: 6-phosphogluconate dehydrogenase (decarboxylating) [Candidatus Levybacteria bacterium RIFCSPHIGHO2_02_FULL_37_13]OGH37380.1 MAG: 6-phosphogluconate dehydrogenase (decarboxylating) [Candidatus Levybacteria bacterium RIFCSPLOWO2_01_FULL_37_26]
MKIGFIGLGKMGSRIVQKLLREGHEVVAWNRSDHKLKNVETLEELIRSLEKPRIVWTMVTAGEATQNILDELSKFVEKDDIIIDGGNSRFKDTEKRFKDFKTKGIKFLGIGVSGGIIAFENGYPLMVGGDKRGYDYIAPVLDSLSSPNGGHEYFGEGGAGHFVKMIHNGIEYGIMQSLGEGFGILEKAEYNFDLVKVAKLWQKGTLVSGFMLDRVVEVLSNPSILSSIDGYIEESGEAKWTVDQAKEEGVPIDVIEKSLEFRRKSQKYKDVQNSFAAKMISGLRNAFGGHEFKKK